MGKLGYVFFKSLMEHEGIASVGATPYAMIIRRKSSADLKQIEKHLVQACELATGEKGLYIDDVGPVFDAADGSNIRM